MTKYQIVIILSGILLLSSCILADRSGCPTYLTLDFSKTPEWIDSIYLITQDTDGEERLFEINRGDFFPSMEMSISKNTHRIGIYGNISSMRYDKGFVIPYGNCCDKLYTSFIKTECRDDIAYEEVSFRKDFIDINIKLLGEPEDDESIKVSLTGHSIGYDPSGKIIDGAFYHAPSVLTYRGDSPPYVICSSTVSRQTDNELSLQILDVTQNGYTEILNVSLSEKLKEAGISMESQNLGDLFLTIDLSHSSMSISVIGFDAKDQIHISI